MEMQKPRRPVSLLASVTDESEARLCASLGADIIVYGSIGDADGTRVAARLPADAQARAGKLALRYAPQHVHWFDPASGKRIDA